MREIDSAECIKNICLCINGKITLEQIKAEHAKQQQNPQKDRRDGILTARYNANRRDNGQFDFGPDSGSGVSNSNSSADKKTDSKKSKSKKSKTENSSKKESSFEEKAKNAKNSLNLQAGGIKFDSSKIWGAGNFEINNLEPNKEYTLVGEFTYSYYDILEGKDVTEISKIAIDIRTDENGSAKVNRVGIVGEYTGDGETAKYAGGELGIGVKWSLAEGKTSDNYADTDKFKVEDLTHAENRELREKYGLGYYGMFHACQQGWTNTEDTKGYSGGGISGQKDPDGLVEILNESIEFDSETGKTKISKGLKNDAKGRY